MSYALVLLRRGCFYRRVNGEEALIDAATAYLTVPGDEQQIAHPLDGGDRCTVLRIDPTVLDDLVGGEPRSRTFLVGAKTDLEHRRLVMSSLAGTDELEFEERAWHVLAEVLRAYELHQAGPRRRSSLLRRRAVDRTRETLSAQRAPSLTVLAREAAMSPHHLSRVFREHTGLTLTDYRNAVRVRRALERLAEGERSLARVAVESGFADQPQLTRAVRRLTGTTPGALRAALGGSG
jgi:AraC-like DNA-binding protein